MIGGQRMQVGLPHTGKTAEVTAEPGTYQITVEPGITITAPRTTKSWIDTGLAFTTRHGTPIEPRNFNRSFDRRIIHSGVSKIMVHGTRKTCGSPARRPRRPPASGHTDPAAQQDRSHHGDLHRGALGGHP